MPDLLLTWRLVLVKSRVFVSGLLALCLLMTSCVARGQTDTVNSPMSMDKADNADWVTGWAMAPHRNVVENISFEKQTLRQIVFLGTGGEALRVRLSNLYGPAAVTINSVSIGQQRRNAHLLAGSLRRLTFSSKPGVTIAPGAHVLSDPVSLKVNDNSYLAVSLYFDQITATDGWHRRSFQRSYVIDGDATERERVKVQYATTVWHWLSGIEVSGSASRGTIVAIGDSTTDGYELDSGKNQNWSDVLQQRLFKQPRPEFRYSVVNLGIGGNRLIHDTDELGFGQNLLDRLERDVFNQSAVSDVIVLAGINDIGIPVTPPEHLQLSDKIRSETVTADKIIDGLKILIERTRTRGIGVIGATILPFKGAAYFTANGERTRQAVNEWIRKSAAFDSYIDFDAMLRDPAQPARLLPTYDIGDQLHPNARGHRAMAEGIDLNIFR